MYLSMEFAWLGPGQLLVTMVPVSLMKILNLSKSSTCIKKDEHQDVRGLWSYMILYSSRGLIFAIFADRCLGAKIIPSKCFI